MRAGGALLMNELFAAIADEETRARPNTAVLIWKRMRIDPLFSLVTYYGVSALL